MATRDQKKEKKEEEINKELDLHLEHLQRLRFTNCYSHDATARNQEMLIETRAKIAELQYELQETINKKNE